MAQHDPEKSTEHAAAHIPTQFEAGVESAALAPLSPDEAMFALIEGPGPIGAEDSPASREADEPAGKPNDGEPEDRLEDDPIRENHALDAPQPERDAGARDGDSAAQEPLDQEPLDQEPLDQEPLDQEPLNTDGAILAAVESLPPIVAGDAPAIHEAAETNDGQAGDRLQAKVHLENDPTEEDHAAGRHASDRDLESHGLDAPDPREPAPDEPDQPQPALTGGAEVAPVDGPNLGAHVPEPAAPEPPKPPEPPRKKGFWQKFTIFIALLGLGATGGGLAAIQFKDKDARLKAVSDVIEGAAKDPKAFFLLLEKKAAKWLTDATPKSERAATNSSAAPEPRRSAVVAQGEKTQETATQSAAPLAAAPQQTAPAAPPRPREAAPPIEPKPPSERPGWAAIPLEKKPEPKPKPTPPVSSAAPPAPIAPPPVAVAVPVAVVKDARDEEERQRLVGRIERLEVAAKAALEAAKEAREAKAAERPAAAQPSPEEGTYLNALEGRIDELADEIRVVRERLDSPKNETRLAPEAAEAIKPAPGKPGGTASEIVVVAQSLAHELERGRPYAAEQAALANLGADSDQLAALAPSAASGAPTAAQLRKSFAPVARRLRALEAPKTGSSLTDHLLQEASKLVKVRPAGAPAVETISDIAARIETALAHDDVGAAAEAFARLPDNAKAEAKAFGEALNRRRDAEKAAASLLSNAIGALGRAKK